MLTQFLQWIFSGIKENICWHEYTFVNRCENDGLYSKDELHNLHFWCKYCGKEMDYDEDRECLG